MQGLRALCGYGVGSGMRCNDGQTVDADACSGTILAHCIVGDVIGDHARTRQSACPYLSRNRDSCLVWQGVSGEKNSERRGL